MNPVRRHELTNDQWDRLAPLLPPQRPHTGRPAKNHRTVLNGILRILRTGAHGMICPTEARHWLDDDRILYREWPLIGQTINRLQALAAHRRPV